MFTGYQQSQFSNRKTLEEETTNINVKIEYNKEILQILTSPTTLFNSAQCLIYTKSESNENSTEKEMKNPCPREAKKYSPTKN